MRERNGVRQGQRVRSIDGADLGQVTHLHEQTFAVRKGFPILFGQHRVLRYDEVRGERDGALVVARSDRDLFELAAGGVPASWRVPTPPGFPGVATPAEARGVYAAVAGRPFQPVKPGEAPATPGRPSHGWLGPNQALQARAAAGEADARQA